MKKWMKITLGVIGLIILLLVIDLICVFTINRPLLAIKKDNGSVYRGIFYDTYNCAEYSIPQVKRKGLKLACANNSSKVKEIIDKTKGIEGFSCDTALENFYEDDEFTYSWSCIKNEYMIVKYESGYEETISNALKYGSITISDLDKYNISYIKAKKEDNDEHSFFGRVVESHQSYIIVEPNEGEEERNSSDKFHIKLGEYNDAIYKVGTNVKITYIGGINESYPAQIGTTKIELKSVDNFELIFNQEPGNVKRQIIDKKTNKTYDYNVYIYNGNVEIVIDKKTYSLEDALKDNRITMNEIIEKANQEIENPIMYRDGGSVEYHYDDYTIIKLHTIEGNRDVYIGNKDLILNNLN